MVALVVAVRLRWEIRDAAAGAGGGVPVTTAVRGAGAGDISTWVVQSFIEAEAPGVRCSEHGVVVA